ncbi:putative membrane protein [Caldisphaera lagunensis DSM 15908]|uniref:Putative membrane protein n=1 Tax=Caldisphaera lagunensis (strain DSM 15908 / JCM 11604 / ANMR 0165 / IC-154) TaxID=1056495 RepID=L0ACG2_CALLD|nr:DUF373 family protein [Caldisphaera lagunensis]AFZ71094.1 putative membrane protein [Caldisphaera lagunensis DSM 15908]
MSENTKKPLILIIDIDDDIGSVTGKSLVYGKEDVMKAALEFAEKRPEDADTNAIFAGLNLYESMKNSSKEPDIAIVGGHPTNTLLAQMFVKDRVKQLIDKIGNNVELYLVSDGTDELLIAEVLRELAPIAGLKRVIVEQHLGVEGSYFLLARYIRKAINDPRYSKYFLGIPGVLIALFGILSIFGYIILALKVILAIAGIFLILKGFNIENKSYNAMRSLANYLRETSHFQIAGLGILAVTILASIVAGYYSFVTRPKNLIILIGSVSANSLPILLAGFTLYIVVARIFYKVTKSNLYIFKEIASIAVIVSLAFAFSQLGLSLETYGLSLNLITASDIINIFIGSGFLLYSVAGAGVAALIELVDYLYFRHYKRAEDK